MVGIVLVSHSAELAQGLSELARQMAGPDVRIVPAGGGPDGRLGTSGDLVKSAIECAEQGDGVVVLCDLGSSILTVRHLLEGNGNGSGERVRLVDAPLVEGAIAAAVVSSAARPLDEVVSAAEEARGASKL